MESERDPFNEDRQSRKSSPALPKPSIQEQSSKHMTLLIVAEGVYIHMYHIGLFMA